MMCAMLLFSLAACGGKGGNAEKESSADNASSVEEQQESSEAEQDTTDEQDTVGENDEADPSVDIDLTTLSSTMVYAQVSDMVTNPDEFVGKKVKCSGPFGVYTDEDGKNFYACIIRDATACCAQGMEFELKGEHKYPEDYPKQEEEITVIGTFDKYEDKGATYCTLRKAEIVES